MRWLWAALYVMTELRVVITGNFVPETFSVWIALAETRKQGSRNALFEVTKLFERHLKIAHPVKA